MNDRTRENNCDQASKDASNSDGAHKGDSLPKNDPNGDPSPKDASDAETSPMENLGLKDGDRLEAQNDSNVHCQNDAMKWSWVECLVLYISKNPWKFCWGLLAVINLAHIGEILWSPLPSAFQEVLDLRTELIASIFDAQVTFVGLIFPIAVSLIGLLIKDKLANEVLWDIYTDYSSYRLVGGSGFGLILAYLCFAAFKPLLNDEFQLFVVDSLILWFVLNVLLSVWFFRATFGFVSSHQRTTILLKYVANECLPYEQAENQPDDQLTQTKLSSSYIVTMIWEQLMDSVYEGKALLYKENLKLLKELMLLIYPKQDQERIKKFDEELQDNSYRMTQSLLQKNPVDSPMVREWIRFFPTLFDNLDKKGTIPHTQLRTYLSAYLCCWGQFQQYKTRHISLNQGDQNDLAVLEFYFNEAWKKWKIYINCRKKCKNFTSYRRELILHSLLALYDAFQCNDASSLDVAFENVKFVIKNYPQTQEPSTGNPLGELESESDFIFACFGLLILRLASKITCDKRILLKPMVRDLRLYTKTKDNIGAILAIYLRACVRGDNDPTLFEQQVTYFDNQLKFRKINILGVTTTYEPLINTRVSTVCKLLLLNGPVFGIKNACLKNVENLDKEKLRQYLLNLRNISIEPELADRCLDMNKEELDEASSSINQAIDDVLQRMKR